MKITELLQPGPTGSSEPAKKGDFSPARLLLYDCRVRPPRSLPRQLNSPYTGSDIDFQYYFSLAQVGIYLRVLQ